MPELKNKRTSILMVSFFPNKYEHASPRTYAESYKSIATSKVDLYIRADVKINATMFC